MSRVISPSSPRLLALGLARHPSMRLRFEQYVGALEAAGFEVEILSLRQGARLTGRQLAAVVRAVHRADVVFVQRLLHTWLTLLLQVSRKPVVFDLDDSTYFLRSSQIEASRSSSFTGALISWFRLAARGGTQYSSRKRPLEHMLRVADLAVAGNRTILEDMRRFKARGGLAVIPTAVPEAHVEAPNRDSEAPVRIGWVGVRAGLQFLDHVQPALVSIGTRFGDKVMLSICCSVPYPIDGIQTEFVPWNLEAEKEFLRTIDIGLMPLPDDPYERGKCGFKAILCMSYGVPVVVSPVGVNREIVEPSVNGLHAETPEEWEEALVRLIEDADLRNRMGAAAMRTVADRYSATLAAEQLANVLMGVSTKGVDTRDFLVAQQRPT